jgi:hypothetical protein
MDEAIAKSVRDRAERLGTARRDDHPGCLKRPARDRGAHVARDVRRVRERFDLLA